jgi:hypothetical protein
MTAKTCNGNGYGNSYGYRNSNQVNCNSAQIRDAND